MIISKESVISNSLPSIFWRMYSVFTLPQKRKFIIVLLLLLTQGFFEIIGLALILPLLYVAQDPTRVFDNHYLKSVYDFFQFNSTESFTVFLALILIFAFVFKGLYSLFVIRYQTKTSFEFAQSYINDQIKIGLEMDYLKFKSRNSNVMVQDMISIPTEFATNIMQPFLMLLSELIVALFIAIVVGYYNFKVFVGLIVVLLPPIVLFYRITRKKIIQLGHERNSLRAESFKFAFGAIHGIENVKITHSEDFFRFQILKSFKWLFEKSRKI